MKNSWMKKPSMKIDESDALAEEIIACRRCPRLIEHCQAVAEKKIMRRSAFAEENYWGRPVPNFGSWPAKLLIVGLAPGAHGSNRTSRMFTGDDSGLWLYRALHKAGFAATPNSLHVGDNRLINAQITSVIHCAPPGNKPETAEVKKCEPFLVETIRSARPKVILALGSLAWSQSLKAAEEVYDLNFGRGKSRPAFKHGARVDTKNAPVLLASFHVSRQNTNTKKLTEKMLDDVFATARRLAT